MIERNAISHLVYKETVAYYRSILKSLRPTKKGERLRVSDKSLLANWYVPAVLIFLLDIEKIKTLTDINYDRLKKVFGIAKPEAQKLVALFERHALLQIDPEDGLHIVFDRVTVELPQKEFVRTTQNELNRRLDSDFAKQDAIFRAVVLSISSHRIPDFKADLLEVIDRYAHATPEQKDARLIQGTIGFFPVI